VYEKHLQVALAHFRTLYPETTADDLMYIMFMVRSGEPLHIFKLLNATGPNIVFWGDTYRAVPSRDISVNIVILDGLK